MQLFADLFYGDNYEHKIANITCNSHTDYEAILEGIYDILSPDFSHSYQGARTYMEAVSSLSDYDVWFPIKYINPLTKKEENDRYIHPGQISHGCISIYNLAKWNDLFMYLMSYRTNNNGKYIGTIEIIDKTNGEYIRQIQHWKKAL